MSKAIDSIRSARVVSGYFIHVMNHFIVAMIFAGTVFGSPHRVYAVPIEQVSVETSIPRRPEHVLKEIRLLPPGLTVDAPISIDLDLQNLRIKKNSIYEQYLGVFWKSKGVSSLIPSTLDAEKGLISVSLEKTGTYQLAVITPLHKEFQLSRSIDVPHLGEIFTVSSQSIIATNANMIWDGFPFKINAHNLDLIGVIDDTIRTKDGKISFEAKLKNPGPAELRIISRDFPQQSAFGKMVIPAVAGAFCERPIVFKRHLWMGLRGKDVTHLQQLLSRLSFFDEQPSGIYDRATLEAVYRFQVKEEIVKTPLNPKTNGSVGEKTRLALNAVCP